jgi:hypothetical protein
LEIWRFSVAPRIFNAFSPYAKLPHPIADIRIGECLVARMFNQLRMNLRRPLTVFLEMFDQDSLLHGYGKRPKGVEELLSVSNFISSKDCPVAFHMTMATT